MEKQPPPITVDQIRSMFSKSADFKMEKYELEHANGHVLPIYVMHCEGMADSKQINQFILPRLERMHLDEHSVLELDKKLDLSRITKPEQITDYVFRGLAVLFFESLDVLYALDIANPPTRGIEESAVEIPIKGPRDSFVEDLSANVALVRKRLRTSTLCNEQFTIGARSQTKVALLYIEDITNPDYVTEAKKRLNAIHFDVLLGVSELEKLVSDNSSSLFPLLDWTTRPDYVADGLIHGRFAILADGSPSAILGPGNITYLLKSPEDVYFPFYFSSFGMIIRLIGLAIALLLPGFWVALGSYNIEQLPYPLLATIALSRIGLPMPGPLEAFLMVAMFEVFREAGERLPKVVGQTVAVVGGIVVGDAAIRAGLASTTLIVVAAITAVANYTLVNQSLVGSITIQRMFVLLCAAVLGMYGFMLSVITIVVYLSRLESFGVPYLAPLSPPRWKDLIAAIIRKPLHLVKRRPEILKPTDPTRGGDES